MAYGEQAQLLDYSIPVERGKELPITLFDLLAQATPHGYEYLIYPILKRYFNEYASSYFKDKMGNIFAYVKSEDVPITALTTMYSCHIDTAHRGLYGKQKNPPLIHPVFLKTPDEVKIKELSLSYGMVYGTERTFSQKNKEIELWPSTLGADDKIGTYILLKMMEERIPGFYAFHVGEEVGCVGSKYSSKAMVERLKNITKCIAFDRAGYSDVIAHQRGRRCASVSFTDAIAAELNAALPARCNTRFKGDIHGVYTDSAEYADTVAECTNLSVGYWNQHGDTEHFDALWLTKLLIPAILKVKWNDLAISRDPIKKEYENRSWNYGGTTRGQLPFVPGTQAISHRVSNTGEEYFGGLRKPKLEEVQDIKYATELKSVPVWTPQMGTIEGGSSTVLRKLMYAYIVRTLLKNSFGMSILADDFWNRETNLQAEQNRLKSKVQTLEAELSRLHIKHANSNELKDNNHLPRKAFRRMGTMYSFAQKIMEMIPDDEFKEQPIVLERKKELEKELIILAERIIKEQPTCHLYESLLTLCNRVYFLARVEQLIKIKGLRGLANKLKNAMGA